MELNKNQRLDNFIVGKSNELAFSYCKNCQNLKLPTMFVGNSGIGKTHLLNAVGNELSQKGFKVIYLWTEEFLDEYINAIYHHQLDRFIKIFLDYDVILVDRLEACMGKESTTKMIGILLEEWNRQHQIVCLASSLEGSRWIQNYFENIDIVMIEDFDDELSKKMVKTEFEKHTELDIKKDINRIVNIKYKNMYQIYSAMQEVLISEFTRQLEN